MELDIDKVRANVEQAATEDLLDRATVFRDQMEPEALAVIDSELTNRKISENRREAHRNAREPILRDEEGRALRCDRCHRPARIVQRRWQRLLGLIPVFPRSVRLCHEHSQPGT